MERKYKINSAISIFKMVVSFSDINEEATQIINVGVDYFNNRVFFDEPLIDGVDYDDLEQEILLKLRLPEIEPPKISPQLLQKIADVRQGKYDTTNTGAH